MSGSRGNSQHDSTRYPCGVCEEEVVDFGARAVACNSCDIWIHKSCVGMLMAEYDQLAETSQPWFCPDCGTAHHSSVIYDIPVSDVSDQTSSHSSISSEDALTSPQPSSFQQSCASSLFDSSINSIGSPGATSSLQPTRPSHATSQGKRSLRILVINFQSVRKKGKSIDILVETTCPDVILGTETWLSNDIPSSYFFDQGPGYSVHRRDRPNDPHGGVLIAVKNNLEMTNIVESRDLELISGTLIITKTKKMLLCAYYRPPDKTSEVYLQQVKDELSALKKKHKNAIFITGGDFNLPDTDWDKTTSLQQMLPA